MCACVLSSTPFHRWEELNDLSRLHTPKDVLTPTMGVTLQLTPIPTIRRPNSVWYASQKAFEGWFGLRWGPCFGAWWAECSRERTRTELILGTGRTQWKARHLHRKEPSPGTRRLDGSLIWDSPGRPVSCGESAACRSLQSPLFCCGSWRHLGQPAVAWWIRLQLCVCCAPSWIPVISLPPSWSLSIAITLSPECPWTPWHDYLPEKMPPNTRNGSPVSSLQKKSND